MIIVFRSFISIVARIIAVCAPLVEMRKTTLNNNDDNIVRAAASVSIRDVD